MLYKLKFTPLAWKEWQKIDRSIQKQLQKKLKERLQQPHVPSSKLRGFSAVYKIKQRSSGYRLVYKVIDEKIVVLVIAIGKRNHGDVYKRMDQRLSHREND